MPRKRPTKAAVEGNVQGVAQVTPFAPAPTPAPEPAPAPAKQAYPMTVTDLMSGLKVTTY